MFLSLGGRSQDTSGGIPPLTSTVTPAKIVTLPTTAVAPKVIAPSPGVSDGIARMTFTTGSKVASGFTPQKDEDEEEATVPVAANAEIDRAKRDLFDCLDIGDKAASEEINSEIMSTPKKGRLDGGDDPAMIVSTPKSTTK